MPRAKPVAKPNIEGSLVTSFRGRRLPVPAYLAGYSALIERFKLNVPLHHEMAAISTTSSRRKEEGWIIYPNALRPSERVIDNLTFALKHEGVQLLALKHIFVNMDKSELERAIRAKPTSAYIRRLCFFTNGCLTSDLKFQILLMEHTQKLSTPINNTGQISISTTSDSEFVITYLECLSFAR